MPDRTLTRKENWKQTYQKHGTDVAVGMKTIAAESAESTTRTLKKYTGR